MRVPAYKVAAFLGMISVAMMSVAQQAELLSKHGAQVKHTSEKLLSGSPVSVFLINGEEEDGEFFSARETTMVLYDGATHSEVIVNYDSVRTIKQGTPKSRRWHTAAIVVPIACAIVLIVSYAVTSK